jgi:lactoylglutathione lyase
MNESGSVAAGRPNGEGTQSGSSLEPSSPRLSVLGYVILYVSDLSASIAFYRDVLELTFKFQDAGYAEFATGDCRFGLYERRRAEWLVGREVAPGPAAEIVFLVDDVDAHACRLAARGVSIISGPADRPWGHRTVHIPDPDGFIVELAQEIPRRRLRRSRP